MTPVSPLAIPGRSWERPATRLARVVFAPVQLVLSAPSLLFLTALTAMLLRHPDVQFYEIDRVAFGLLVVGVESKALVQDEPRKDERAGPDQKGDRRETQIGQNENGVNLKLSKVPFLREYQPGQME